MQEENNSKEKSSVKDDELNDPAKAGKKAIEASKKLNEQNKTEEQKENESKKDAEQWRNEG